MIYNPLVVNTPVYCAVRSFALPVWFTCMVPLPVTGQETVSPVETKKVALAFTIIPFEPMLVWLTVVNETLAPVFEIITPLGLMAVFKSCPAIDPPKSTVRLVKVSVPVYCAVKSFVPEPVCVTLIVPLPETDPDIVAVFIGINFPFTTVPPEPGV